MEIIQLSFILTHMYVFLVSTLASIPHKFPIQK